MSSRNSRDEVRQLDYHLGVVETLQTTITNVREQADALDEDMELVGAAGHEISEYLRQAEDRIGDLRTQILERLYTLVVGR